MPTIQGQRIFLGGETYSGTFGTPTVTATPQYAGGPGSLAIDSPGTEGVRMSYAGGETRAWMAFALQIPSIPAADVSLAFIHSVTSNIDARFSLASSGRIYAFIGAGAVQNGPILSASTWYWIEAIYDATSATHQLNWRVAGADQTAATVSATGSDTYSYNQLVSLAGDGTLTWNTGLWLWGSANSSSDYLGEPQTFPYAVRPPMMIGG